MCKVSREGSYDEQLENLQDKVDKQENQIDDLKDRLVTLEKKKRKK